MTFFRCMASAIAALAMGLGSAAAQTTELLPVGRILLDGVLAREKAAHAATDPFSQRFREAAPRFPIESCAFAGGLCGAIDRDGRVVVPPRYDWVDTFAEGRAMVRSKGLFGIVDETGREIVAPRFEGLALSQDGLAIFDLDGKMGAIDRDGKVVIEPKQAYLGRLGKTRFALADAREAIAISGSKWTKNGGITFFGSFRTAEFLRSKIRIEEHNRQLEIFPKGSLRIVDLRAGDQDHIRFDALFSPTSSSEHATILAAKTVAGWGILGADGSWLTEPQFSDMRTAGSGYLSFKQDDRWGLIDQHGKLVIAPTFIQPPRVHPNLVIGKLGDKWGATDLSGKVALPAEFDRIIYLGNGKLAASRGKMQGLIDSAGQWLIEPRYDLLYPLSDTSGGPWRTRLDGKYGFVTEEARVLMEPRFTSIPTVCPDGRILGQIEKKLHMFDKNGREITPARGEAQFWSSCTGPYNFTLDGKVGQVDADMKEVLPPIYDAVARPSAKFNGKWGLLNSDGTWRLPPEYDAVNPVGSANALVKKDGRTGLIRAADQRWMTTFDGDEVCSIRDEVILSKSEDRRRFFSPDGTMMFDVQSDRIGLTPTAGLIMTRKPAEKWGYIDLTGRTIIDFAYDQATPFRRGVAWVRTGAEWCAIDRRGDRVPSIPCAPIDADEGTPGTMRCRLE